MDLGVARFTARALFAVSWTCRNSAVCC